MNNGDLVLYGGLPLGSVRLQCERHWTNAFGMHVTNESHSLRIHVVETGEQGECCLRSYCCGVLPMLSVVCLYMSGWVGGSAILCTLHDFVCVHVLQRLVTCPCPPTNANCVMR